LLRLALRLSGGLLLASARGINHGQRWEITEEAVEKFGPSQVFKSAMKPADLFSGQSFFRRSEFQHHLVV